MSCSYYTFRNNDYYCLKKDDYVNEDTYNKYCRNYNYDECPIYKNEANSGGCYITTACVYSLGCSDDCDELNTLRNFRDKFLKKQKNGVLDVKEYYEYAPFIVNEINKCNNRVQIYRDIFTEYIKPCLILINNNNLEEAYELYKTMYYKLKKVYIENK